MLDTSPDDRLADLAAGAALSACVAAAVIVPCVFDPRAERVFDEPKVLILRSVAPLAVTALVVWTIAVRHRRSIVAARFRDARALLISAAILTAAYVTASLASIAPRIAWDGAYVRRQGTYAFLSYLVCFLVVSFVVRTRNQVRHLSETLILASVFPTAYGICQFLGFDVATWNNPAHSRITSTAGNPIFLGGYLIMVWPITLAHCVQTGGWLRRARQPVAKTLAQRLATVALSALVAAQTIAIGLTGSIGAWLALAAVLATLVGVLLDRFTLTARTALLITVAVGVATLATVATTRRPLRPPSPSSATSESAMGVSRTGEVRLLLWRSATNLVRENPARALIGYGPDTIRWTLGRYEPAAVRQLEGTATADRSHNAVLDTVLTIGLLGLFGHTLVLGTICVYAMRRLGWIGSIRPPSSLAWSVAIASAICLVLTKRVDNSGALLPLVWAGGLVGGMFVFLFCRGLRSREVAAWDRDDVLHAALLAGVVGHYVEIQTGIATAASELYFWLFAAMIGVSVRDDSAAGKAISNAPANRNGLALGIASGLVLATITFDFADRLFDPWLPLALFTVLAGATLMIGAALLSTGDDVEAGTGVTYFSAAFGVWLTFVLVSSAWTALTSATIDQADPEATRLAEHAMAQLVALSVTIVAACAVIAGSRCAREVDRPARPRVRWRRGVMPSLLLAAFAIALFVNMRALHADESSNMGEAFARAGYWERAERFQFRARALQPNRDVYLARLGQTQIDAFRTGAGDRVSRLETAREAYVAARHISPYDPDHLLQLALIESLWVDAGIADEETPRHLQTASDDLAAAARLAPRDPEVWNAWGKIRLRQHDVSGALASFEHSVAFDEASPDTHLLYADALLGAGLDERALQEYETAQTLASGKSLPAISGKALALVKLHRVTEAIAANSQALRIAPQDYASRKNLALLYEQVGDLPQALSFAVAAAAVGDASEKNAIDAFVGELQARLHGKPARVR